MKKIPLIVFFLAVNFCYSQKELDVEGEVAATAVFSSENMIPFWFYTNSNTALGSETNFSAIGSIKLKYQIGEGTLEAGTAWFYRDGLTDEFQRRDIYARYANNWLKVTLGSKQQDEEASGLSATNKNFLWSSNARPIPGLVAEANEPFRVSNTFAIDWGLAHYRLNDERYVSDVNIHYKRLGLITTFNENNKLTTRLQHFAQWGGNSPIIGELPGDLKAYVDVFFAKKRILVAENMTFQNALGNHMGTYFFEFETINSIGQFNFYHEHPFEDGSGTRFANFPDGVWGIHFKPVSAKIINEVLYEYIDTSDQSGPGAASGRDGYFSNNVYRSGWSYEGNVIGVPFIIFDKSIELTDINSPYTSNRARVHHLGVTGTFKKIQWKLKSTYVTQLGTYRNPFITSLKNWHNYATFTYPTQKYGEFTALVGADFSSIVTDVYAAGLEYRFSF